MEAIDLFTNRRRLLDTLAENVRLIEVGRGENTALIGLRRIGKTEAIYRFRQEHPEYFLPLLNVEGNAIAPSIFALSYVGAILRELARHRGEPSPKKNSATDLMAAAGSFSHPVREAVTSLVSELDKAKPSPHILLRVAFEFPELVAQEEAVYPFVCLDEFQAILDLRRFPELANVVALFRSVIEPQKRVRYLIAGSAITLLEEMLTDASQPLFGQFRVEQVQPFERLDTYELAEKIWRAEGREYQDEGKLRVWMLSWGHPFYITAIASMAGSISARLRQPIDADVVSMAFVEETLRPVGRVALLCKHLYEYSIGRARGEAILRTTLRVLAEEEGLTTGEVASRMRRRPGNLVRYLDTLASVDLLRVVTERQSGGRIERRYYFRDPILRFWLSYAEMGVSFDRAFTDLATARRLSQEFEERYLRASAEMGRYFEGHVRDLCHRFQGQTVDGRFFNMEGEVRLPVVSEVSNLEARDEEGRVHGHPAQVELDLYLQGDRIWLGEVKHSGGPMNRGDLELLVRKAEFFREEQGIEYERLWAIANEGFKETAREYAAEQGILTSARFDLRKLERVLGK